jgi:uncharacterized protein (TIGR00251 family)
MIPLKETESGVVLAARVKAGSGKFSISQKEGFLEIRTKSPAEDNKANLEIIKELSRLFGKEVRILRGLKSRNKEILVVGASEWDVGKAIS